MTTIVFDIETGGLEMRHPIIQLAAVAVIDSGKIMDEFQRKIQFREEEADAKALEVNHYDRLVWDREAKPLDAVLMEFSRFLEPHKHIECVSRQGTSYRVARLAAYNAYFDAPRLQKAYRDAGHFLAADPRVLCILQLVMWVDRPGPGSLPSYKLADVAGRMSIPVNRAHDALADCRIAASVMHRLVMHQLVSPCQVEGVW
jgi:DNA polymerase III epsilon subunit-like protein